MGTEKAELLLRYPDFILVVMNNSSSRRMTALPSQYHTMLGQNRSIATRGVNHSGDRQGKARVRREVNHR